MAQRVDSSDGDLARAVSAQVPGSAEDAETELYRRFAPRVRLYGLRHLRDEEAARDLVQQVMLLTIEKLRGGSIRDADQIGSFILGVSRTMALDSEPARAPAGAASREVRRRTSGCPSRMSTPRSTSIAWRRVSAASPAASG